MNWRPDDEERDESIGKALLRREELANMVTAFTLACINKQVQAPATTAIQLAVQVRSYLDKETPFPE